MTLNKGEEQSLIDQLFGHLYATERKLKALGLHSINLKIYDKRTGHAMTVEDAISMANSKPGTPAPGKSAEQLGLPPIVTQEDTTTPPSATQVTPDGAQEES